MSRRSPLQYCQTISIALILVATASFAYIDPNPGAGSRGGGKKIQDLQPRPGFSGGQTLNNNVVRWCNNPALPGCQACPDGRKCSACWTQFSNATGSRFELNPFTGQCDCAAGYGLLPTLPPPTWPPAGSRHLLEQLPPLPLDDAAEAATTEATKDANSTPAATASTAQPQGSTAASASHAQTLAAMLAAVNATEQAHLQDVPPGLWLPDPLPAWASNCLPCPVNYYSAGGQQGFAQCLPCPGDYSTAGATAAANCLFPFCGPGQEPTRRSARCRFCPLGSYSSATANNQPCYPCPKGFTTAAVGSRVYTDCRVPICLPGTELDLDLFVCNPCQGNSISPGGRASQGTAQPQCQECPYGTAANQARTVCYSGACPYPDNFRISCRTVNLLNDTDYFLCGPNGKEVSINQYCTAYPPGARLAVYQPATTTSMAQLLPSIACPAGAWSSSTKFPVIVSFNGRTDCLCPVNSNVSCWFVSGPEARVAYPGGTAQAQTVFAGNGIDIPDPQADSLNTLVTAIAGTNATTAYQALESGYCQPQQLLQLVSAANWTNPLQVNCTGSYISRISLDPSANDWAGPWTANGYLPNAVGVRGLSQLRVLACPNCGLQGTLPRDWGTQPSLMELRTLDLSNNSFVGTLPETWGYLVNLASFSLSSSNTTTMGLVPSAWGYMRSLVFVNFTGLYVDNSAVSCLPWQWSALNQLVFNDTLLPPANYPNMTFCDLPFSGAA